MNCDLRAIVIVLNQLYDMQVYSTLFSFLLNQKPLARFGYKDLNIIFFQKQPYTGVLQKKVVKIFCKIHRKTIELESLFNKVLLLIFFTKLLKFFKSITLSRNHPNNFFQYGIGGICGIAFKDIFTYNLS